METTNNETHNHNYTNDDDCRRCADCGKREGGK
jgi:hypothetical protein